ncbi:MAG: response regulator [Candidatus Omnitrophota bacterium]|jgi:DNA-binding response OmpR family regulator|nr:MAG: response regulator [Candidatus Omnitrophota bacterium]
MMVSKSKIILVIDDDESLFRSIRALFHAEIGKDLLILHAPTGRTALAELEKKFVTVCIVDHKLPDMDGLDVLKVLHDRYSYIPSIYLSGFLDEELKEKVLSFDYGAYYTVDKPFLPDELIRKTLICLKEGGRNWANKLIRDYADTHRDPASKKKKIKREARLFTICEWIDKESGHWTSGMLARDLEVTPRTIQTDIRRLIELGKPIYTVGNKLFLRKDENKAK